MLSECYQRTYLLRQLRSQGLALSGIKIVYQAIIVSKLLYAMSVWGGFLSAELIGAINSFLKHMVRFGFTDTIVDFDCLLSNSELKLFSKMQNYNHCFHSLLPELRQTVLNLRSRGHNFILPSNCSNLHQQFILPRCLFNFI
jgi:hypothetical protein